MRIDAPFLADPALTRVLDALEGAGHRALAVGGCVRDAVLGRPVGDVDLATDARPDAVIAAAEAAGLRAVPTGIAHGTVTLVSGGRGFEVTTFRRDVATDGRHAVVAFTDALAEDAARRDFTLNALYARRDGTLVDPVGGLPDLRARRLRFVGDPAARIAEDALRILRFYRFLAQLEAQADPASARACAAAAPAVDGLSRERVGGEMRRLLAARDPRRALAMMAAAGLLTRVLPGAALASLNALVAAEDDTPAGWPLRLAALAAADPVAALRLSRAEARDQAGLAEAAAAGWSPAEAAYRLGPALAAAHARLLAARGAPAAPDWPAQIAAARPLPITASDLMPALAGPALGAGLKAAETAWIASGFTLSRAALIAAARKDAG